MRSQQEKRYCENCGLEIIDGPVSKIYCSTRCRVAKHRWQMQFDAAMTRWENLTVERRIECLKELFRRWVIEAKAKGPAPETENERLERIANEIELPSDERPLTPSTIGDDIAHEYGDMSDIGVIDSETA